MEKLPAYVLEVSHEVFVSINLIYWVNGDTVFDAVNPFPAKGFHIDE